MANFSLSSDRLCVEVQSPSIYRRWRSSRGVLRLVRLFSVVLVVRPAPGQARADARACKPGIVERKEAPATVGGPHCRWGGAAEARLWPAAHIADLFDERDAARPRHVRPLQSAGRSHLPRPIAPPAVGAMQFIDVAHARPLAAVMRVRERDEVAVGTLTAAPLAIIHAIEAALIPKPKIPSAQE